MKKALITGITGQDGSYLAEFLLEKGYEVHGIKRRASLFNTQRVDHIYQDPHEPQPKMKLHYGDLSDTSNLTRLLRDIEPDEVYNLGAQSHVAVSFEAPEYTADVDAMGTLRLLEAIRFLGLEKKTRFYQASTSELYGLVQEIPQSETTPFHPRSPYAVAKMYAYWIAVNYREAYGMYACNGILFNHESPRRGETFVTRKITRGMSNIAMGLESCLYMGNIDALRDWGHAKDYVRMQWMMLQQDAPEDFVIATGVQYSVREFIKWTAGELGIELEFTGEGVEETATVKSVDNNISPAVKVGDVIVKIDPRYFRPAEVETSTGPGRGLGIASACGRCDKCGFRGTPQTIIGNKNLGGLSPPVAPVIRTVWSFPETLQNPGIWTGRKVTDRMARKHWLASLAILAMTSPAAYAQQRDTGDELWARPVVSFKGYPSILDMPSAHQMPDADLTIAAAVLGPDIRRYSLSFQITERLSGVFRYGLIRGYRNRDDYYDRSFDLRYQLLEESLRWPAVTVGLQDFGGTGILAGEYLVGTKTFGRLRVTGGLGWGRFGSYKGFENPLSPLSDKFKTRPSGGGRRNRSVRRRSMVSRRRGLLRRSAVSAERSSCAERRVFL